MQKPVTESSEQTWSDATTRLHLAKKKLAPVIKSLMESASCGDSDHPVRPTVTVEEYSEAVWAAGVLEEVNLLLAKSSMAKRRAKAQPDKFDFPKKDIKVNETGNVCIDTSVLVQLIELHQALGMTIKEISEMKHEPEAAVCAKKDNHKKADNIVLKVIDDPDDSTTSTDQTAPTKCSNKPGRHIVVMAANVVTDHDEPRKTKSTGSLYEKSPTVKNSACARKIIINCIADLDKVRQFLETDKDAFREDLNCDDDVSVPKSRREKENVRIDDSPQEIILSDQPTDTSSKIVICIKGQNDEDLQIVIRQCPECRNTYDQKTMQTVHQTFAGDAILSDGGGSSGGSGPRHVRSNQSIASYKNPPRAGHQDVEVLHGNNMMTEESDTTERSKLSVLFNAQDPSKSIVDCVPINLYDQHRMCVKTENGEELVLTLTVTPKLLGRSAPPKGDRSEGDQSPPVTPGAASTTPSKDQPPPQVDVASEFREPQVERLTIRDIFSDPSVRQMGVEVAPEVASTSSGPDEPSTKPPRKGTPKSTSTKQQREQFIFPIYRTKICSSLQFDVEVAPSTMRDKGIQYDDENLALHFNKLGVNNLLRACRPVKCSRPVVLNEPARKSLPYSPSLKSLPLDEQDVDIIAQSLEMSVTRSKTSTMYLRKPTKVANHQVYYFQVHLDDAVRKYQKMQYYIHLESDLTTYNPDGVYGKSLWKLANQRRDVEEGRKDRKVISPIYKYRRKRSKLRKSPLATVSSCASLIVSNTTASLSPNCSCSKSKFTLKSKLNLVLDPAPQEPSFSITELNEESESSNHHPFQTCRNVC